VLADSANLDRAILAIEPGDILLHATDKRLDGMAYAFAAVIDAKTPFTARHSTNVARDAVGIATSMGAYSDMCRDILRAGLLYDIGKLGVSNRILDKPVKLTDEEFGEIRTHPRWTWEISARVTAIKSHVLDAAAALGERGTFVVLAEGRDDPFPQLRQEPAKFIRTTSVA